MRRVHPFQLIAFALISPAILQAEGGTDRSLYQFTDKEGKRIEARILSLSGDRRFVKIEREDQQTFDLEITRLSLDDQQRLKDWFSENQSAMDALQLELSADRTIEDTGKERIDGPLYRATWEKHGLKYSISVTSLTTSDVSNLKLEYCLFLKKRISVREAAAVSEDDPVRWRTQVDQVQYKMGTADLGTLKFNREEIFETESMPFDTVRFSGGKRDAGEDEPIGILVRVVDSKGVPVAEFSDLGRSYSKLSWESLESQRDPAESKGMGMLVDQMVAR